VDELLKSCQCKEKLYIKYKKNPTPENKDRYTKYRNSFKKLRILAKKSYYEAEFLKHSQDMRMTWKLIKDLITGFRGSSEVEILRIDREVIEDPEVIASNFNKFFAGIGKSLALEIPV